VLGAILAALAITAAPAAAQVRTAVDPSSGRISIGGLGGARLVEVQRSSTQPGGRAGFEVGGRWHHATRVLSIRRLGATTRATLASDDPRGRRILLRVRSGAGAAAVQIAVAGPQLGAVRAVGIGFRAAVGERYLGFGERSNAVDQRGRTIDSYVEEGPFLATDYPIVERTIPPWGIRRRSDATYFPMPWLLSTRGFGVLVNNLQTSRYRLGSVSADEWSVEADARRLRLAVLAGPDPADVVRRLTERVGRQPKPQAPWQLGPWFQTGHSNTEPDELAHADALRAADAPVSAVETHMRYMPCGSDRGQAAAERARTAALHARGLAALTYTREAICESYEGPYRRAVATDAFLERPDGTPWTFEAFVGSGTTQVGILDFTDPDAFPIYRSILDRAYRNGYDGWMEDYGEYAPPGSVAEDGKKGLRVHNAYPISYHRAGARYAASKRRPVVRFVRSGWSGVHPHAAIVWGGDPSTTWDFDGLRSSLHQALTMGLSGISSWGSDIGGFFTITGPPLTPELLARWIQFGALSGVMRTKAEGIIVPKETRPQIWEQPTLPIWRRYAKLRTQLYPYLVAADRRYRRSGLPIMRHLALAHPGDPRAVATDDQFLFGDSLLAAPVLEPGSSSREVYLPRGRWVNFWETFRYRERDGAFRLGGATTLRGGRKTSAAAPLEQIPIFVRAGAVLPMLPAGVDTLARYGGRAVTRLADRRDRLRLLALPRGRSSSRFGAGGTVRSSEGRRSLRLRIAAPRRIRLQIDVSLRTLRRPFRPRVVLVDGRPARGWSYDRASGVLSLTLRARRATIRIAAERGSGGDGSEPGGGGEAPQQPEPCAADRLRC
jgi:alpha-glucosidase (family GH31 glycosyl hydrolase)